MIDMQLYELSNIPLDLKQDSHGPGSQGKVGKMKKG